MIFIINIIILIISLFDSKTWITALYRLKTLINTVLSTTHTKYQYQTETKPQTNTKRSVSETKKKFVASEQDWKCKHCHKKLPAWFEVDHVIRLDRGGTNDISNLVALCRECHGKKTMMENINNTIRHR